MLDLFLYCDLAASHVSARGAMDLDAVADVLRLIDRLAPDRTVVVDLTDAATDDVSLAALHDELTERSERSTFRVIEPLVARVPALDAA